ncbi:MAG: RtcB family protein [candidate division WOR-3 bacterium]|nr:RtcB family protein [candidate division WOR-3 bacterium]MCX7948112.1 RtcB family protein [candidate division WOR-3 bacterium]MDW8150810.1 RtcB family protein [candidate division WOR-3 bacterium]
MKNWKKILEKITDYKWRIPKSYKDGMNVDGIIFATEDLLNDIIEEGEALEQVANVATLPGIVKYSIAMPDIHWGYGFAIGGVAAFDPEDGGIISPGGVGYDINCGVRIIRTNLKEEDIEKYKIKLADKLYNYVPSGVGARSKFKFSDSELERITQEGLKYLKKLGYTWEDDHNHIEEFGSMPGADFSKVSQTAKERGRDQLGTIGSGNHFLEVQVVDEIYDEEIAKKLGLFKGQVVIMIHCGSRGFGHQIASDYIKSFDRILSKYNIKLVDRQLSCAPFNSNEGQDYYKAMVCAANFAWSNRQLITYQVRKAFSEVLNRSAESLEMSILYDVAHNIAKLEEHDGKKLVVHRKGATRALPKGHKLLPPSYKDIGQPVLIPGDMGSYSYILIGMPKAIEESFASSCHGAGRVLSRTKAKKLVQKSSLLKRLTEKGIVVRAESDATLLEEAPEAYKDVSKVVEAVELAGISKKVSRNRPIIVVKG